MPTEPSQLLRRLSKLLECTEQDIVEFIQATALGEAQQKQKGRLDITWKVARHRALAIIRRNEARWMGFNYLLRRIGCGKKTLRAAINRSSYLLKSETEYKEKYQEWLKTKRRQKFEDYMRSLAYKDSYTV